MLRRKSVFGGGSGLKRMIISGVLFLTCLLTAGLAALPLAAEEMKASTMAEAQKHPGMMAAMNMPVEHPMMKPAHYTDKGKCPNCGMMLNMWARTRHQYHLDGAEEETCSIHCLAERAARQGKDAADVKVALYLAPEKMIPAEQAVYVIGSEAPGTMTNISKLAFADRAAAEKFVADYGGVISDYGRAYQQAVAQLGKDRASIDTKRKKSGKIIEPTAADRCVVCGMPPANYPNNRAQILTSDNKTLHFCSGRCLVYFMADPSQYGHAGVKPMFIWATVFPEAMYDYAAGLFYVAGSKGLGPMGPEPFAFRTRKDAADFMAEKGGAFMPFEKLTPAEIVR
ncbi:MAG: nitrous oxide reductase accessory protein NosL [Desulfobulbaceae bacterium]